MQVGVAEFGVLVVARERARARELAASVESAADGSAATAAGVVEGREQLADHEFDAVLLKVPAEEPAAAVRALADGDGRPPLVAVLDGIDVDAETVLDAGATDVVVGDDGAVMANRLEMALSAARAEQTAREVRQRYHRLLDASSAPIIIFDADGDLLYANPAVASLVGAEDPHDVVGRNVFAGVDDDDEPAVRDAVERLVEDGEAARCEEIQVRGVDGQVRYIDAAGSPVTVDGEPGVQAMLTEVTELKERERRLRTERDRFTALFESLPEPAVHVRYEDGEPVVQNVNTAFEEVFGHDVATVRGENLNEYIVPDDRREKAIEMDEATADGTHLERDVRREAADGLREFRFSARSMPTAEGAEEGVGVYVDITERTEREAALERQNERLDAFASIVSHDLQSPLSVAKGNLYLAREEGDEVYLGNVDEALDRMEQIIEDLLRLARTGEGGVEPEPVDAGAAVTEAWQGVDGTGATLENALDLEVLADPGQFRELVGNLVRNAVEHGGEDVTVTVGEVDGEDGTTGFYVADDGPGIPLEEREDVFEPGYTTHEEGTGFGLVVVEEIARAHGWQPAVTESVDGGARFEFVGVERA